MVFEKLKKFVEKRNETKLFLNASTEEVFTHIYSKNKWGDPDSRSGKGSNLSITTDLRESIPALLEQLQVASMLDIPCGDFHWMKEVTLPFDNYIGADIVKTLIDENNRLYGNDQRAFLKLDLMRDKLPDVEAIFCRDCLVHLCFDDISMALENIKNSKARYLITTNFPQLNANEDCITGKHRPLNFGLKPFAWPDPLKEQVEGRSDRHGIKCLSVWEIADLP